MGNMVLKKTLDLRDTIFSDKPHSITISGWWYTYPSEKYEFVSWDDDIPNIWENKKCSKPPTRYIKFNHSHMAIKNYAFTSIFFPLDISIEVGNVPRFSIETILPYDFPMLFHCHIWCTIDHVLNRPPSTDLLIAFPHIPIIPNHHKKLPLIILVGGIPTPLKNMSSSDWIIIPTIGENKIHVPNHQPNG